jgi:hypothetical protein
MEVAVNIDRRTSRFDATPARYAVGVLGAKSVIEVMTLADRRVGSDVPHVGVSCVGRADRLPELDQGR